MNKLTVEQLMQSRYEVIADYPDSPFNIGGIYVYGQRLPAPGMPRGMEYYPHLFRKLKWWEKRVYDEMPEYLITVHKDKWVCRVHHHFVEVADRIGFTIESGRRKSYCNYLPATETEYLSYINKTKA